MHYVSTATLNSTQSLSNLLHDSTHCQLLYVLTLFLSLGQHIIGCYLTGLFPNVSLLVGTNLIRYFTADIFREIRLGLRKIRHSWNPWFSVNFKKFTLICEDFEILSYVSKQNLSFAVCHTSVHSNTYCLITQQLAKWLLQKKLNAWLHMSFTLMLHIRIRKHYFFTFLLLWNRAHEISVNYCSNCIHDCSVNLRIFSKSILWNMFFLEIGLVTNYWLLFFRCVFPGESTNTFLENIFIIAGGDKVINSPLKSLKISNVKTEAGQINDWTSSRSFHS